MNLSNKKPQSRPPKSIDDGDLVNYCQQSINFYHHPSESSKNQSIENDEFQRHFIYNNQNRGEILNNIDSSDSSDLSDLSDFEVEIKPHIAVQKKDRDIHDQKKTKISQQKGKSKVVNESEDEFQLNNLKPSRYKMLEIQQNKLMIDKKHTKDINYTKKNPPKIAKTKQYDAYQNQSSQQYDVNESKDQFHLNHFKPNGYKMLEIQQNKLMIDKKHTKDINYTKKNPPKIAKTKQYDAYQNQSSQEQYEHFGKAKKNPLQPILANQTIAITKHQTNNPQINAVIRNHKPAVIRNDEPAVISNYQPAESLCYRIWRAICPLPQVQRTNTPIYQDRNTSRQKVQRTNARTYQGHNKSRQNLNISRLDATNIINTSRFDATNNDISQYSYRQNDSSRPLDNHKSSFEIFGLNDPDRLVPQKAKKGMFR